MRPLTKRQRSVLGYLARKTGAGGWVRPMDVGGEDGNGVAAVLVALCRRGLARRKVRGGWAFIRRSYVYRVTSEGQEEVRRWSSASETG